MSVGLWATVLSGPAANRPRRSWYQALAVPGEAKIGMSDALTTYVYQFGIGGLLYFLSVWLLLRAGALGPDAQARRRWIVILAVAFCFYAVGLGLLQFLGPMYDLRLGAA